MSVGPKRCIDIKWVPLTPRNRKSFLLGALFKLRPCDDRDSAVHQQIQGNARWSETTLSYILILEICAAILPYCRAATAHIAAA